MQATHTVSDWQKTTSQNVNFISNEKTDCTRTFGPILFKDSICYVMLSFCLQIVWYGNRMNGFDSEVVLNPIWWAYQNDEWYFQFRFKGLMTLIVDQKKIENENKWTIIFIYNALNSIKSVRRLEYELYEVGPNPIW